MFKKIKSSIFGKSSDDEESEKPVENEVKRPKVDEDAEKEEVVEKVEKTPEKKAPETAPPAKPANVKVSSGGWKEEDAKEGVDVQVNTLNSIIGSFDGLFMNDDELANIMTMMKENPTGEIDFKWHAALDDSVEGCTTYLRIDGMQLPFSSVLFRSFVEKPGQMAALQGPDSFKTAGSTIFVQCRDIDSARRQFRRLNGHVWPGQVESTLSVTYTTPDAVQEELESHSKRASEEESRLRKTIEDKLLESQRKKASETSERSQKTPTKETREADRSQKKRASDYFPKTTSTPRVFYELEDDAGKIADATTRAQEEYDKLIAAH